MQSRLGNKCYSTKSTRKNNNGFVCRDGMVHIVSNGIVSLGAVVERTRVYSLYNLKMKAHNIGLQ